MAADWEQIVAIFERALEMAPAGRAAFLDAACAADESLRAEVESLLEADERATRFIETPALGATIAANLRNGDSPPESAPERIGPYRIERELGRGGMGAVYLAERVADFRQKAAVKVIKRGLDTDEIVRRFAHERQILASLDHPHIARLLDGGTTDAGAPYFVMEYVAGEELLAYCDRRALGLDARLALFREVCAAVAYAHRNLVVHRDLKPSNILVTGDGRAKLLDFGIAKPLSDDAGESQTATALGMLTPKYASPEQFRGERATTATDVYSLGVVLYELLTGALPYDFTGRRPDEIARIVSETDPIRPSAVLNSRFQIPNSKLKTGENGRTTASPDRPNNPKSKIQNPKSLKGDLDNIILKAISKEPARRYATVEQLAEDLRRYQAGLPVTARRDTFVYRAAKFLRRHRAASIAALLIALTLVAGVFATVRQKRRAERRYEIARALANNVLFKYHDEIRRLPGSMRAREMLVVDALAYLNRLRDDAADDAPLRREIAQAYYKVGGLQMSLYDDAADNAAAAVESFGRAAEMQEALLRESPRDEDLRRELADSYGKRGEAFAVKLEFDAALDSYASAQRHYEAALAARPDDARLLLPLVAVLRGVDNLTEAPAETHLENVRRMLALAEKARAQTPGDAGLTTLVATLRTDVGRFLGHPEMSPLNRLDESLAELARAHEMLRGLVARHPEDQSYPGIYASSLMVAADVFIERGEAPAAVARTAEALTIARRRADADAANLNAQIQLAYALGHHARALTAAGRLAEAAEPQRQAQRIFADRAKLTETNPGLLELAMDLQEGAGDTFFKLERYEAAAESYRRAADAAGRLRRKISRQASASAHAARLAVKLGLAADRSSVGDAATRRAEAVRLLRQGSEAYRPLAEKKLLPLRDLRFDAAARAELARLAAV